MLDLPSHLSPIVTFIMENAYISKQLVAIAQLYHLTFNVSIGPSMCLLVLLLPLLLVQRLQVVACLQDLLKPQHLP